MAHEPADPVYAHALPGKLGAVAVAQHVRGQLGFGQPPPPAVEQALQHAPRADQRVPLAEPELHPLQHGAQLRRHDDVAVLVLAPDPHAVQLELDVLPAQPGNLGATQPGQREHGHDVRVALGGRHGIPADQVDQLADPAHRQRVERPLPGAWSLHVVHRVPRDPAAPCCQAQHAGDDRDLVPPHGRRADAGSLAGPGKLANHVRRYGVQRRRLTDLARHDAAVVAVVVPGTCRSPGRGKLDLEALQAVLERQDALGQLRRAHPDRPAVRGVCVVAQRPVDPLAVDRDDGPVATLAATDERRKTAAHGGAKGAAQEQRIPGGGCMATGYGKFRWRRDSESSHGGCRCSSAESEAASAPGAATVLADPHRLACPLHPDSGGGGAGRGAGRPRLLDLFCGAGGCAVGYHRAGFDVVGVDLRPQPRYPFEFHQGDALEFLEAHGHEFDAVHASPPCQGYSVTKSIWLLTAHPMLVEDVRMALAAAGRPYVIENVTGAPLARGAIMLCGLMFGLRVYRHRWFESNIPLLAPGGHPRHQGRTLSSEAYSSFAAGADIICVAGHNFRREDGAEAMGIDWPMTRPEMTQAIPPAYTAYLGRQLMAFVRAGKGAG